VRKNKKHAKINANLLISFDIFEKWSSKEKDGEKLSMVRFLKK